MSETSIDLAFAQGLSVISDEGLLEEVSGLVEWPVVLMGPIGDEFLDLPPEVLRTSMKEHQKFFSVRNPGTGRIEGFVTVANIETTAARLGDKTAPVKDAVQPGRRITTLRNRDVGMSVRTALISPPVSS